MKVNEHIDQAAGKTLFSFEILPPLKGENIGAIFANVEPLMDYAPSFVNVTYHREEYVFIERENGLLQKKIVRKRPGTIGICAALQNKYRVDAIPHILCGGFSKEDTENFLIEIDFLGIENVMALRGDAIKSEMYFKAHPEGNVHAVDLVRQIQAMNEGTYLDEVLENCAKTNFEIGVAAYPEKHMEAASLDQDLFYLKKKVDAGAKYLITQLFFDNQKYFDFVDRCRAIGIHVPIIPGIKPLATKNQLSMIPQRFKVDLPQDLVIDVIRAETPQKVREIGEAWCIAQCKELIEKGAPVLHFYTMGKSDSIQRILKSVF